MIPRRYVLGSGVLGGVVGLLATNDAGAAPGAAQQQLTDRSFDGMVRAIESVRDEMRTDRSFQEIQSVRAVQRTYLRDRGKLPDFIEVGQEIWFGIHDWHIRWQQPLALGRDGSGRYTLVLLQTVLILRTDMLPGYVGDPYDKQQ
jgi:hypothetical protein